VTLLVTLWLLAAFRALFTHGRSLFAPPLALALVDWRNLTTLHGRLQWAACVGRGQHGRLASCLC
jgi:hypothetical protein